MIPSTVILLLSIASSCPDVSTAPLSPLSDLSPTNAEGVPVEPLVTAALRGRPVPTNDWFSSLVWPWRSRHSEPLFPHPLSVQAVPDGLEVGYPDRPLVTRDWFAYPHTADLRVGLAGLWSGETRLHSFSDWVVTARWSDGERRLDATFGHGLPFVFVEAVGTIRIDFAAEAEVWRVEPALIGVRLRDHDYLLVGNRSGRWETASGHVTWSSPRELARVAVALLPERTGVEPDGGMIETLAAAARRPVLGSEVRWRYAAETGVVEASFELDIEEADDEAQAGARESWSVMALYPHQWQNTRARFEKYSYRSARGEMKVLRASSFETSTSFVGVLPRLPLTVETLEPDRLESLRRSFSRELRQVRAEPLPAPAYELGKRLAQIGFVADVAEDLGRTDDKQELLDRLQAGLERALGDGGDFAYERTWGSWVPIRPSHGAVRELNDHHLQYGHYLMAAATLSRHRPEWTSRWRNRVELLTRDPASIDRCDPFFPFLRTFDPYAGHSWASGHGGFHGGNNQESASEALNFAAALLLWASEVGDWSLRDAAAFLYATEAESLRRYWLGGDPSTRPATFEPTRIGILWSYGGSHSTWWTADRAAVHGINLFPPGPALFQLARLDPESPILRAEPDGDAGWRRVLLAGLAVSSPEEALSRLAPDPLDFAAAREPWPELLVRHWILALSQLGPVNASISASWPLALSFHSAGSSARVAYTPADGRERRIVYDDGCELVAAHGGFHSTRDCEH